MKAIKAIDNQPVLVDASEPKGDGVKVRVVSSSICDSDIHMMAAGAFGGHIIGHEFAGFTGDGRAVAIEPITGCGQCASCDEGLRVHCDAGIYVMGVLGDGGMAYAIQARHDHQKAAAEKLGADLNPYGHYDVVIDAVGSSASLLQSAQMTKTLGRIGLVGVSWESIDVEQTFFAKEAELIPSLGYNCKSPNRNFEEAGKILHRYPDIADALVTHRYPLDGVAEAFATAADRAAGAIKVVFDIA